MSLSKLLLLLLLNLSIAFQVAASSKNIKNEWITLGTMGGPVPNSGHSQPSNALIINGKTYLIDAGDGTAGQLSKAGLSIEDVEAVFISHLHFDHTSGLPAVLSLRWQVDAENELTVYGPPGIKQTVEGIFQYMAYGAKGHFGVPGQVHNDPSNNVKVVELHNGAVVDLDGFKLTSVRNSHYSWPEKSREWQKFQSFSYKFDLPEYSVVYTGDTGPSKAVEKLADNVDLLVSEMMDVDFIVNLIKQESPHMPPEAFSNISKHLSHHHLLPSDVGMLAKVAKVKKLVITHMAPAVSNEKQESMYTNQIAEYYKGEIIIADDLSRFELVKN